MSDMASTMQCWVVLVSLCRTYSGQAVPDRAIEWHRTGSCNFNMVEKVIIGSFHNVFLEENDTKEEEKRKIVINMMLLMTLP